MPAIPVSRFASGQRGAILRQTGAWLIVFGSFFILRLGRPEHHG
ncbi:hypothetical protein SXCC_01097 [Gluconacetobacter sp. SXCC-1]|nr:hypothetical protein SXCC_01097 [Gluconacetobacter sp. SXCC-1]